MLLATTLESFLPRSVPALPRALVADAVMLAVTYACGTFQLMVVGPMDLVPALLAAVVPFIVPDAVKLGVGASIGCAVARAEGRITRHA